MKHRSVIAFILLLAALFAAPQISHDISALKSALGARIRFELLHALVNLKDNEGANELVTRPAAPLLASYQAKDKACAQPQPSTKKSDGRAQVLPHAVISAQTDAIEQLAMLVDPMSTMGQARAALSNVEAHSVIGEAVSLHESIFMHGDFAKPDSPDSVVESPAFTDVHLNISNKKDATRRLRRSAETRTRVAYVATDFEKFNGPKVGEEMLRRIGATLNDTDVIRATEKGMRVQVLKFKRVNREGGNNSKASAPQPATMNASPRVPVAALVPPNLAPPVLLSANAGE